MEMKKKDLEYHSGDFRLHILDMYSKMDELLILKTMHKMKKTPEYATPFL
jgi:hypothetical protein